MKYQIHKCCSSCQRLVFNKKTKKKALLCRYGFLRPVQDHASLNTVEKALKTQYSSGAKRVRLYNLARKSTEIYVNDYNPEILLLWRNNMDIQFIGTIEQALNRYVTGYMTKSEKNNTAAIWNECNSNKTLHGKLKSFALKSFKTREIGIYEAADRLNGRASCEGSDQITYLNPIEAKDRPRKLKKFSDIKKLKENDTDIFHHIVIDNYYPNRPIALETLCLYDFVTDYDFQSKPCSHLNINSTRCHRLMNNLGYICFRIHSKLVKLSTVKVFDPKTTERYFHHMLISFQPWRDEAKIKGDFSTYQEAFKDATNNEHTNTLYTRYVDKKKRIEEAVKFCNKMATDALHDSTNLSDYDCDVSIEMTSSQERILNLGVTDLPSAYMPQSTVLHYESTLNHQQRDIYQEIVDHIQHQELHKTNGCNCQNQPTGIRRFISGVAGKNFETLNKNY